MSEIKIKKGLDIHIKGSAAPTVALADCDDYAVKPTDYVGLVPRLLVAEGDSVKAGTPLFEDKANPGIPFVSPIDGTVKAIVRGDKRALLAVVVSASEASHNNSSTELQYTDSDNVRHIMQQSGLWTLLRQRPFGIVPPASATSKGIFISAFDSSPLPVDMTFALTGRDKDFQTGIDVLHTLAGKVVMSLDANSQRNSFLAHVANADIHFVNGPHPAGLVGTLIAKTDPINKGETVWTVNAQDVATIGHYFSTGEYRPERCVALCGPVVNKPQYFRALTGASISSICTKESLAEPHSRIICGDVLSGTAVSHDGFLSAACDKISVLPEGDYYDFMGWLRPNFKKFSFSHTFLSGFFGKQLKNLQFDTGTHGSVRPLFVTGEFEKLVPLDIYPMQLIKACLVGDIELMEELGIYEVEPEDMALCEFADTSKTEIQAIVRAGLEKIRKES